MSCDFYQNLKKKILGDFPRAPVAKTWHSQCAGQGARTHTPQLKISRVMTKTQHSQIVTIREKIGVSHVTVDNGVTEAFKEYLRWKWQESQPLMGTTLEPHEQDTKESVGWCGDQKPMAPGRCAACLTQARVQLQLFTQPSPQLALESETV